jgi:hypothetical protein
MNRYQTSTPRLALGLAAMAMTALTIGVGVLLPTTMQSADRVAVMLATATPIAVADVPARIGVIGVGLSGVAKGTAPAAAATSAKTQG